MESKRKGASFITYNIQFNLITARTKNCYFIVLGSKVWAPKSQIIYPNVHSWEEAESAVQRNRLKACGFYMRL